MKQLPDKLTIGQAYEPAMQIRDQAEADEYFEALVQRLMRVRTPMTREKAEEHVRRDLGYFAGYYDNETRERVERLFRCAHPVFGSIAENGAPTVEAAIDSGRRAAGGGQ